MQKAGKIGRTAGRAAQQTVRHRGPAIPKHMDVKAQGLHVSNIPGKLVNRAINGQQRVFIGKKPEGYNYLEGVVRRRTLGGRPVPQKQISPELRRALKLQLQHPNLAQALLTPQHSLPVLYGALFGASSSRSRPTRVVKKKKAKSVSAKSKQSPLVYSLSKRPVRRRARHRGGAYVSI